MKYSIITINYNNCKGLRQSIESVINQTCKDFEYIVIDGGSTDGSVDVIKEYADRIDYWVSEKDKGIYNAMNKGISHAQGEYLNFLNSGDYFFSDNVLADMKEHLTKDIVFGRARTPNGFDICPYSKHITFYTLCAYGFNHQATFYKQSLFSHRRYDEEFQIMSDWKLTAECLIVDQCSYSVVDNVVVKFNIEGVSYQHKDKSKEELFQIIRQLLPANISEDYVKFGNMRSPLLDYIPQLQRTDRIHKLVVWIVKKLLSLSNLYAKTKHRSR